MARGNFPPCLAVTLEYEGGWSDHPRDPGGATMKGIILATYRQYKPGASKDDLRRITDAEVEAIYKDGYWNRVAADDLPHGVDLAVFDFGVNSGPNRAAKYLQRAVGVAQDGTVGPMTLAAVGGKDPAGLVRRICRDRLSFVQQIRNFDVFGRGWTRRCVEVEAKGVAMAIAAARAEPWDATRELADEAQQQDAIATRQQASGVTSGAAGGTAAVTDAVSTGDPNWIAYAAVFVLVAIGAALLIRSRANRERAKAYRQQAAQVSA